MGPRRSGKTSIQRVVFYKMSPHETLFQDSTSGLDIKFVANNSFVQFQIWDFPGDFDFRSEPVYGGQVIDEQMIFGAVGALVLVIDAQDEPYQEAVSSLVETIRRAVAINPNLFFEVFIHKVDGDLFLSDDEKIECQRDIQQHITEELEDANLPDVNLSYHLTSIYDHSIFEAFSTVVQNLIPQIHALENLLNCLISNCNMEKSFLFDVVSRIYIATDSNPVEMQAYELCSDMIDVVIDVSCIYGVKSGVEGEGDGVAFDSESSSVIRLDNGMVLYLHEVSGYLALVSWLKADNFKKKGLIDYNIQVFKEALSKVFQGGDPKIDSAPQPLMLEEEGSEAKGSGR
ncbi:unnamed protein product [Chrysoparadoxa australica]